MDDTDRQLLSLLRDDARASVASIAKVLRVSRGTVQNRLARLEADGWVQQVNGWFETCAAGANST